MPGGKDTVIIPGPLLLTVEDMDQWIWIWIWTVEDTDQLMSMNAQQ